jgi:hypothetical protein
MHSRIPLLLWVAFGSTVHAAEGMWKWGGLPGSDAHCADRPSRSGAHRHQSAAHPTRRPRSPRYRQRPRPGCRPHLSVFPTRNLEARHRNTVVNTGGIVQVRLRIEPRFDLAIRSRSTSTGSGWRLCHRAPSRWICRTYRGEPTAWSPLSSTMPANRSSKARRSYSSSGRKVSPNPRSGPSCDRVRNPSRPTLFHPSARLAGGYRFAASGRLALTRFPCQPTRAASLQPRPTLPGSSTG